MSATTHEASTAPALRPKRTHPAAIASAVLGVAGLTLTAGIASPFALWKGQQAITAIEEFPDEFDLKYRRVDGYSIKARLKEARERAGTSGAAAAE